MEEVAKLVVIDPVTAVKTLNPDALATVLSAIKVLNIKVAILPDGPPDPGKA